MPFYAIKTTSLKSQKNWHFSKGVNPLFWSKNSHFSNFFLGNIGQEKVFYNIQERKNAFLGYKNKTFKKSKNWHFSKQVNPWFWSKKWHYSAFFFLGNIGQENVFYDIFLKGLTHGFGPKMAIYPTFFFRQYTPGKYLLRYSKTKKRLSRL